MNSLFRFITAALFLVVFLSPVQDTNAANRPVGWQPAGTMLAPRTEHGSALLPDGSVLVAGGFGPLSAGGENYGMASAERYDPLTGQWSFVQPMTTVRFGHTLTRLADGRVLAVGGDDAQTQGLTSAEIYDPVTGQWTLTGSTADAHVEHGSALLEDGRVIVVGGYGAPQGHLGENTDGFEIYNPATGQWSVPAAPPEITNKLAGLVEHSLVRLVDGRVMVIGGSRGANMVVRDVLLFDPASDQWSLASPLLTARGGLAATLLADGRVLVMGGQNALRQTLASAEIYDPATDQWRATGAMAAARVGPTATRLAGGKVLVVGGRDSGNDYDNDSEVFEPRSEVRRPAGTPMHKYQLHTATLLSDGSLLVFGGVENGAVSSAANRYYGPRILFVNSQAGDQGDGSSWTAAFKDLQDALNAALPSDQVWVAAGTYYPTGDSTNRAASFVLRKDVEVYGGFTGTETSLEQRDWAAHETILSGDIDHGQPTATGHSYHVLFNDQWDVISTSVLDGFTITAGQADSGTRDGIDILGGGLYNRDGQPVLRNLVFKNNYGFYGGGVYNKNGYPLITNALFLDNEALYVGGGLENGYQTQAVLTNVTFTGNKAEYGGAMANYAAGWDAGIYNGHANLTHVTIYGNTASIAGGGIVSESSQVVISNSIVWGNTPDQLRDYAGQSTFTVKRSILQGVCPAGSTCENTLSGAPMLGALGSASSGPATFPLLPGSPAFDAVPSAECTQLVANPWVGGKVIPLTFDQRGAPRPSGAGCDMGAHEYNAVMSILSGNDQHTDAGQAFPAPLVVGVTSGWGDIVEDMTIHFTPQVSNAGGRVSSSTAVVRGEQASVTAAAQSAPGFSVLASAPGLSSVLFHLAVNDTTVALAASPNPAAFGDPVDLTTTVTGKFFGLQPSPGGAVTFKEGETTLGIGSLPPADPFGGPSAQAVLHLPALAAGTHTLTAIYSGDSTFHDITTSPPLTLTIAPAPATVTLTIPSPFSTRYSGLPHTVSVTTSPVGLPVRVTYNGGADLPVLPGSYDVYAEITDPNYTGSATGTLTINKAVLDVLANIQDRVYGMPNPPLTYWFRGFVNGEGQEVVHGSPVLICDATPTSPPRSYSIFISPGTLAADNYVFDMWSSKIYISKATPTIQLSASPSAPAYGQPVTLTAAARGPEGSVVTPDGNVTFVIDGAAATTTALGADGQATFTASGLSLGMHTFLAQYAGTANYNPSSSDRLDVTVAPIPAAVTLSGLSASYDGQPHGVTVTTDPAGLAYRVTYGGQAAPPTRAGDYTVYAEITEPLYNGSSTGTLTIAKAALTVQSKDAARVYGAPDPPLEYTLTGFVNDETSAVVSGAPVLASSAAIDSPVGDYALTVDVGTLAADNYTFTTGAPGTTGGMLTILKAATTTAVTPSRGPALRGEPVTLTATISPVLPSTLTPGGIVTFTINSAAQPPVPLVNGKASITFTPSKAGSLPYQVQYQPDGNHTASSATGTLTVKAGNAKVSLSGLSVTYDGWPHPPTVNTEPAGLAVRITYDGQAEPPVDAGNYTVLAEVEDPMYDGLASAPLTIAKAATTLRLVVSPNPATAGQTVTLIATVAAEEITLPAGIQPDGHVTFTVAGSDPLGLPQLVVPVGVDGTATAQVVPPVGDLRVTAQYAGDGNFNGSCAGPVALAAGWMHVFVPFVGR